MSRSEARFQARMLFGRTRTLSDEQRSEQSERARRTIMKEAPLALSGQGAASSRTACSGLRLVAPHPFPPTNFKHKHV